MTLGDESRPAVFTLTLGDPCSGANLSIGVGDDNPFDTDAENPFIYVLEADAFIIEYNKDTLVTSDVTAFCGAFKCEFTKQTGDPIDDVFTE